MNFFKRIGELLQSKYCNGCDRIRYVFRFKNGYTKCRSCIKAERCGCAKATRI